MNVLSGRVGLPPVPQFPRNVFEGVSSIRNDKPEVLKSLAAEARGDGTLAYRLLEQAIDEREPLAVTTLADRCSDMPGSSLSGAPRKTNLA